MLRCRDHGALICAGELGRKSDDNGGFSRLPCHFKRADEVVRGCLTGGGQHITLDQLLIECSVVDGHAVDVFLLTEMNGERHRIDPLFDLGDQIRGGINNDPCFQFLQASCFPLLWAIASKLLLMAERLR